MAFPHVAPKKNTRTSLPFRCFREIQRCGPHCLTDRAAHLAKELGFRELDAGELLSDVREILGRDLIEHGPFADAGLRRSAAPRRFAAELRSWVQIFTDCNMEAQNGNENTSEASKHDIQNSIKI